MNAAHARAVAARMLTLTGEMPAVALSDDPASLSVLTRFRSGGGRWLIVVRMASEGYDCPDIRVVLWATNMTGEGAFRQIVARALRVVPRLSHQDAQVFLPADSRLLALARGLVHPLGRSLRMDDGEGSEDNGMGGNGSGGQGEAAFDRAGEDGAEARDEGGGVFVPLTSRAFGQRMVTNGAVVPVSALERARAMNAAPSGFSGLPDYALAAAIARMESEAETLAEADELEETGVDRSLADHSLPDQSFPDQPGLESALPEATSFARTDLGETSEADETSAIESTENESTENESTENETYESATYDQRRQELRRLCTRLTALVARELDVNPSVVHRAFHRSLRVRQADSTLAELEQRKLRLEDKLRELRASE
ncbi:MAG: hypothetical protein ACRYFS_14735 [Janthinobacterium lividum]